MKTIPSNHQRESKDEDITDRHRTCRFDIGRDNLKLFNELIPPLAKAGLEAKVLVIYCFAVMNNE